MREVYIILTYTGTVPSRIIKYYTKEKYSHVSIALDSGLKQMYSFARLNPYNAFRGGLIHEEIEKGTFNRFKNTIGQVYSFKVTDEEYNKIAELVNNMYRNKETYKFNYLGILLVSLNKKYKTGNRFYCAEFVKYVLETSLAKKLVPEIVKPIDFLKLEGIELIYEGLFRKYKDKNMHKEPYIIFSKELQNLEEYAK